MKLFLRFLMAACFSLGLVLAPALVAENDEGGGAAPEAGEMGPSHGTMMEKMGEKIKESLGLSDAQFKKFQEANKANQEAMKPLREKMADTLKKLKDQVDAKAADKDIQATLDEAAAIQKDIQAQQEKHKDSLKEILTPTQQAKTVLAMAERMKQGMEKHDWKKGKK